MEKNKRRGRSSQKTPQMRFVKGSHRAPRVRGRPRESNSVSRGKWGALLIY
ncbi:hypothetical protein Syun_025067 [Stephania yunnanensis]|uniref:Uncharacterized protein n=1 Tax=Stephania yunnanensis TaxID=152371 RepID=A0AAP0HUJ5_9MAGN